MYILELNTENEDTLQKVFDFLTENDIDYSLPELKEIFNKSDFEAWRSFIINNDFYNDNDDDEYE